MMTPAQKRLLEELERCLDSHRALDFELADDLPGDGVHTHKFWEIVLSRRPSERTFSALTLIPPGCVHRRLSPAGLGTSMVMGVGWCWLSCSYLNQSILGSDAVFEESELLVSHLEMLERWRRVGLPPRRLAEHVLPLLGEILQLLQRTLGDGINERIGDAADMANRYINVNFRRPGLSATEIARNAGVGCHHLTRLFREHYGTTVRGHITLVRLRHACEMLAEDVEPVVHIAAMTGWRSHTYFSRVFRRVFAISPTEFSRRCREEGGSWWRIAEAAAPGWEDKLRRITTERAEKSGEENQSD